MLCECMADCAANFSLHYDVLLLLNIIPSSNGDEPGSYLRAGPMYWGVVGEGFASDK
jgi:hypothetical protein